MSSIIDNVHRLGGAPDILEMAKENRRQQLLQKVEEAIAGSQGGDAAIVCLQVVEQIAKQPNAPQSFKLGLIAMMAGLIVEITK